MFFVYEKSKHMLAVMQVESHTSIVLDFYSAFIHHNSPKPVKQIQAQGCPETVKEYETNKYCDHCHFCKGV